MKETPFWWEAAPPRPGQPHEAVADTDFAILGSGYTGLNAAIDLARSGARVSVFEAQALLGAGASTRNGGQLGHAPPKMAPAELRRRFGEAAAREVEADFDRCFPFLRERVQALGIDCALEVNGYLLAAHTRRALASLASTHAASPASGFIVPEAAMRSELATSAYRGGYVRRDAGSLHPGLYHAGLLRAAEAAGVQLFSGLPVTLIEKGRAGFTLRLGKGAITARHVVLGTNGYTGPATPWLRRRLVPVQSCILATDDLGPARAAALFPGNRPVADTRQVLSYYRLSPCRRRVIFGGRVGFRDLPVAESAARLRRAMLRVFPDLADAAISHAWGGRVAFTFDRLPHYGRHDGLYYAAGYNGSGVAMASYLGHRLAALATSNSGEVPGLGRVPFPDLPGYDGRPWFLPLVGAFFRLQDRLGELTDRRR